MRFRRKYVPGEYYIVSKFLWFPMEAMNGEIRWLERVKFKARYLGSPIAGKWTNIEWCEECKETE